MWETLYLFCMFVINYLYFQVSEDYGYLKLNAHANYYIMESNADDK